MCRETEQKIQLHLCANFLRARVFKRARMRERLCFAVSNLQSACAQKNAIFVCVFSLSVGVSFLFGAMLKHQQGRLHHFETQFSLYDVDGSVYVREPFAKLVVKNCTLVIRILVSVQ